MTIRQPLSTTPTGARLDEIRDSLRIDHSKIICSQCGALDLSTRAIFGVLTCRPCRLAYNRQNQTDIGAEIADDPILTGEAHQ